MPIYEDVDFTEKKYREILRLARSKYDFAKFTDIDYSKKFVLWRHDVDISLNRAEALSKIEEEENVISTYFINPHSEFYNCLEKSQTEIISRIIERGHVIALHLDAEYHSIGNVKQLEEIVAWEAAWMAKVFKTDVSVFSFHNPTEELLAFDEESYGGLINCYSKKFKGNIGYCSDSNGRWRFKNLSDVLEKEEYDRLQVLTHPGWWQEEGLSASRKIRRSVLGRAQNTLEVHEKQLYDAGRYEEQ